MTPPPVVIETARLRLRELGPTDAPFVLELLNEPAFICNIGDRGVRDLESAELYLRSGPLKMYAEYGHGLWMLEARSSGEPIGMCGLIVRPTLELPDIGYALLERYWGRGYASEACRATLEWAVRERGHERVLAIVKPDNTASIRVLEKLDFVAGDIRELTPGDPVRVYAWDA